MAAETALGALGLLGLFGNAIEAMHMFQCYTRQDWDLEMLSTKLENQKARFYIWGEKIDHTCGLEHLKNTTDALVYGAILRTIYQIGLIFDDTDRLGERHGLSWLGSAPCVDYGNTDHPLRSKIARHHSKSARICRWLVKDAKLFEKLVTDLSDLNDDLEALTKLCGPAVSDQVPSPDIIYFYRRPTLDASQNPTEGPAQSSIDPKSRTIGTSHDQQTFFNSSSSGSIIGLHHAQTFMREQPDKIHSTKSAGTRLWAGSHDEYFM